MFSRSFWLMMIIPLVLGVGYPITKLALPHISVIDLLFWRFLAASLCMLGTILFLPHFPRPVILAGIALGVLNFSTACFQTLGLSTISSGQSAFLTGSNVIFVPFLLHLFRLDRLKLFNIFQASICLIGIFFISLGKGIGSFEFSEGTWMTLIAALCVALSLVVFEWVGRDYRQPTLLIFLQLSISALLCGGVGGFTHQLTLPIGFFLWFAILSAALAMCIAFWLQAKYQKQVGGVMTSLIISLQGVYAFMVGALVGEPVRWVEIIGAFLIFLSIALPALKFSSGHLQTKLKSHST